MFCRRRFPKRDMLRFVLNNGDVVVDKTLSYPGRGAYCCMDKECIERARQDAEKVLKRALSPRKRRF